jgi:hypothetical protein
MFSRKDKKSQQQGNPQRVFAGQQTTIANEIRRNLDNYADTQLLEELTQNADDAGATRVAFMLDQRVHATKRVYAGGDMASLQGPALLSFDDAIFKESDFHGLFNFGQGSKKLDPTKSGKFGLGFNTVYHVTEVPMFVSGPYLMVLDPQRKYYPGLEDHSRAPGMQSVVASENWAELADFFGAFQQPVFGSDLQHSSALNGTLFRFPLRTKAQAKKSVLRSAPYPVEGIMNLWHLFEEKASRMLLFLQNLETIEFFVWKDNASAPELLFKSQIHGDQRVLRGAPQRWLKTELEKWGRSTGKEWRTEKGALQQTLAAADASQAPRDTLALTLDITKNGRQRRQTWWVRHGVGQRGSLQLALHKDMIPLTVWPLAGVAALLRQATLPTGAADPTAAGGIPALPTQDTHVSLKLEGLAFASVPTSIQTGLPVHLNGCFLLSDNRRALAGGDSNDRFKSWNKALITDAIAIVYAELLLELRQAPLSVPGYYSYWPDDGSNEEWASIAPPVYDRLKNEPVLCVRTPALNFCTRLVQPHANGSRSASSYGGSGGKNGTGKGRIDGSAYEWSSCQDCCWDNTIRLPTKGGREWAEWMVILTVEYAFEYICIGAGAAGGAAGGGAGGDAKPTAARGAVDRVVVYGKNLGGAKSNKMPKMRPLRKFKIVARALATWIRRKCLIAALLGPLTVAPLKLAELHAFRDTARMLSPSQARLFSTHPRPLLFYSLPYVLGPPPPPPPPSLSLVPPSSTRTGQSNH